MLPPRDLETAGPEEAPGRARGQWMALAAAFLGWMFDGFEMGLFPLVGRPALLELGLTTDTLGPWWTGIIAVFLVGAALGGLFFGWLGDRVGRVRAMVWSVFTYAVFSGLCAFATAPWQLAVLRFIASLGMGGEWSLGVALVMEIWPAARRPILAGLIGAAANVGFLLVALLGLGLARVVGGLEASLLDLGLSGETVSWFLGKDRSGWRVLFLLGAAPALLTFFIRLFVPESERWLHAARTAPKPRVAEIFQGGLAQRTLLGTTLSAIALIGTWGSVQLLPAWAAKMNEAAAGVREWTQIASALGAIAGTLLAAWLAERFSRRGTYFLIALLSIAACTYLFWTPTWTKTWTPTANSWLIAVGLTGCATASFYGWLPLYLPELFPTRVRATGQGFAFNSGRILAAAGTLATAQLHAGEDYARVGRYVMLVYVLGLVVIWFCPETRGKPLPE